MSFSNINDTAAVSALLDQLRASQAWKDILTSNPLPVPRSDHPTSVAVLLSQLQPSAPSGPVLDSSPHITPPADDHDDLRPYTFQQALPVIAKLSADPSFLHEIHQLKQAQDELERRLWEERRAIHRKHEEKVKIAKTKATMIGVGLSKHEADMMNDAHKKDLERFDKERALPAFDSLVAKQQSALADLGVPTMTVSDDKALRERQQRVMQVLTGLLDARDQSMDSTQS
ncbi:hypothetical protein APHAL10511_002043 [Amanita phalloides]|nr:hypothetical protein APHAL10511_002043 [Amanita phalloides]